MGLVGDGAGIDRQDAVAHLQLPAAVRRAALDDAAYFVGHGHTSISRFFVLYVCLFVLFLICFVLHMRVWRRNFARDTVCVCVHRGWIDSFSCIDL